MAKQDIYPPTISYENEQQHDKLPTYSEFIEIAEKYQKNNFNSSTLQNSQNHQTNFSLKEEDFSQPPQYVTLYKS